MALTEEQIKKINLAVMNDIDERCSHYANGYKDIDDDIESATVTCKKLPFTFKKSTPARAEEVNANFEYLLNAYLKQENEIELLRKELDALTNMHVVFK